MYNSLTNAHKGYEYQDLVVSIALIKCLINNWKSIRVDKKLFSGDAFDDLIILTKSEIYKYQIKHSDSKELNLASLSNSKTNYLLKELISSILSDPESNLSQFCLTTNWSSPRASDFEGLTLVSKQLPKLDLPCRSYKIDTSTIQAKKLVNWISSIEKQVCVKNKISLNQFSNLTLHSDLPSYSSDIFNPGDLENILLRLVIDSIGIGKYPHQHRNAEDFAAQVIKLASRSRKDQRVIKKVEIEAELQLITNFGRLPQEIPINKAVVQAREGLQEQLKQKLSESRIHVLRGGPGTGKSWFLSLLAENLSNNKCIIGKHHCYISPIDEDPRLATTQVALANVAAKILDQDESLARHITTKYSISSRELQELIDSASEKYEKVVLIVDGLDHLPRLKIRHPELSPVDINILEPFSRLVFPDNTSVIFGTQPGNEYNKINELFADYNPITHDLPEWPDPDIIELSIAYGIKPFGTFGEKQIDKIIKSIIDKAEGNPLYATYIIKNLLNLILSEELISVEIAIDDLPKYNKDINIYYEYLLSNSGENGSYIALLLAAIPFSIEQVEIEQILGPGLFTSEIVSNGLRSLSSVLTNHSNISGLRIFHESFRRYVFERNDSSIRRNSKDIFDAVATWLISRGFYSDPRAYSYLMKVLISSSTPEIVTSYIEPAFLEKSFNAGFNFSQMSENLRYSMSLGCKLQNWVLVANIIELNRALHTAEFNELEFSNEYWRFGILIISNDAAIQKLIYEGNPYLPKFEGLVFCKLLHENGHIAPWDIYLELEDISEESDENQNKSDEQRRAQELSLLILYGECCIGNADKVTDRTIRFIDKNTKNYGNSTLESYLKNILNVLHSATTQEYHFMKVVDKLESIFHLTSESGKKSIQSILFYAASLNRELWQHSLLIELLEVKEKNNNTACLLYAYSCGAHIPMRRQFEDIAKDWRKFDNRTSDSPEALEKWLDALNILVEHKYSKILQSIHDDISDDSWFNFWKKFCVLIRLSLIVDSKDKKNVFLSSAFLILSKKISPFSGEPRSCDLYNYHSIITNEVMSSFDHIDDKAIRIKAIISICNVINYQSTSLSGSPSGPLMPEPVALRILQWQKNKTTHASIAYFARWLKRYTDSTGSYSDYFRDWYAASAALYNHAHMTRSAKRIWVSSSRFVFGYGHRKDVTFYELLDSIEAVKYIDKCQQEIEVQEIQEICESVVRHTDGRSTSSAPIAWFRAVSRLDTKSAAALLSEAYDERESYGWYLDEAAIHIGASRELLSPQLRAAILLSIPYIERTLDTKAPKHLVAEIDAILEIYDSNQETSIRFANLLFAKIQGQTGSQLGKHLRKTKSVLSSAGLSLPDTWRTPKAKARNDNSYLGNKKWTDIYAKLDAMSTIFIGEPSAASILSYIQHIGDLNYDVRPSYLDVINQLGYSLLELSNTARNETIFELLDYLKQKTVYSINRNSELFADLGEGFSRHKKHELAIHAFIISTSISFNSWSEEEKNRMINCFSKAYKINPEESLKKLSSLINFNFHDPTYSHGWTSGIINLLRTVGKEKDAYNAWKGAKEVIKRRIPVKEPAIYFPKFRYIDNKYSSNYYLAKILLGLSKHPNQLRRYYAYNLLSILDNNEVSAIDLALSSFLRKTCSTLDLRIAFTLIGMIPGLGQNDKTNETITNYSKLDFGTISLLAKKLTSSNTVPNHLISMQYESPIKYRSNWSTESYLINYFTELKDDYIKWLDNFRLLNQNEYYQKNRGELAHHRTDPKGELTPVVLWHFEVCETALDNALNDTLISAWKNGNYDHDVDNITYIINSLTAFDISIGIALRPRPKIDLPSNTITGFADTCLTKNGWVRAASMELEKQLAWNRHDNKGGEWISASLSFLPHTVPTSQLLAESLPIVDKISWLECLVSTPEYEVGTPLFNLVKLGNISFAINAITLSPIVAKVLALKTKDPFDFKWYNKDDKLVACTNIWIERDPLSYNDDRPGLIGSELLITPSLYEQLESIYGEGLSTYKYSFSLSNDVN